MTVHATSRSSPSRRLSPCRARSDARDARGAWCSRGLAAGAGGRLPAVAGARLDARVPSRSRVDRRVLLGTSTARDGAAIVVETIRLPRSLTALLAGRGPRHRRPADADALSESARGSVRAGHLVGRQPWRGDRGARLGNERRGGLRRVDGSSRRRAAHRRGDRRRAGGPRPRARGVVAGGAIRRPC